MGFVGGFRNFRAGWRSALSDLVVSMARDLVSRPDRRQRKPRRALGARFSITLLEASKELKGWSEGWSPGDRRVRVDRTAASDGVIEEVVRGALSPRYRIRWDDGHESIYTPAAGALRPAAPAEKA